MVVFCCCNYGTEIGTSHLVTSAPYGTRLCSHTLRSPRRGNSVTYFLNSARHVSPTLKPPAVIEPKSTSEHCGQEQGLGVISLRRWLLVRVLASRSSPSRLSTQWTQSIEASLGGGGRVILWPPPGTIDGIKSFPFHPIHRVDVLKRFSARDLFQRCVSLVVFPLSRDQVLVMLKVW